MESLHMKKLEKILEYKERINQDVKDVRDITAQVGNKHEMNDVQDLLTYRASLPGTKQTELRKKIDDIIHSMSCIGLLWREDKATQFRDFVSNLNSFFDLCLSQENKQLSIMVLDLPLGIANSFVLPIHESKKWATLIELEPFLTKVKIAIKNF